VNLTHQESEAEVDAEHQAIQAEGCWRWTAAELADIDFEIPEEAIPSAEFFPAHSH